MDRLTKLELQLVKLHDKQRMLAQKISTLRFTNGIDKRADAEFKRVDLEITRVTNKLNDTLFSIGDEKRKLAMKEKGLGKWNGK